MKKRPKVEVYPQASKVSVHIVLDAITVDDMKNEAERMGLSSSEFVNHVVRRFLKKELVDKASLPS